MTWAFKSNVIIIESAFNQLFWSIFMESNWIVATNLIQLDTNSIKPFEMDQNLSKIDQNPSKIDQNPSKMDQNS